MDGPHPFKSNPKLGAKFARYITDGAALELLLSGAFASLTDDRSGNATNIIFHHTRMLSERADLFHDLVQSLPSSHTSKSALSELIPDMRHCITMRNKFAHGVITVNDANEINLVAWLTSKRRKTEIIPIDTDFLNQSSTKGKQDTIRAWL